MDSLLLPVLAKLEWIHESCDPEYKKQKEDAYYEEWRKSIVMTPLWFAIYKGFQQARNELIIMIFDSRMDALRLLSNLRCELKEVEAEFDKQCMRLKEWSMDKRHRESWAADYDMAASDVRYLTRKVKEAENEVRHFDRHLIHISYVKVDMGEVGYSLVAPMCNSTYNSCQREKFYSVEDVFRHFYDRYVKNEQ